MGKWAISLNFIWQSAREFVHIVEQNKDGRETEESPQVFLQAPRHSDMLLITLTSYIVRVIISVQNI